MNRVCEGTVPNRRKSLTDCGEGSKVLVQRPLCTVVNVYVCGFSLLSLCAVVVVIREMRLSRIEGVGGFGLEGRLRSREQG